ncbi:MAG: hypothetical protein O7G29_01250 [Acidobacteria bacterium]|nr:hypothetical protein [Acidobacteriota bacterium]
MKAIKIGRPNWFELAGVSLPRADFRRNPLSDFPKSSVENYEFISGAQQVEAQDAAGTGGLSLGDDPRIGHQFRPIAHPAQSFLL